MKKYLNLYYLINLILLFTLSSCEKSVTDVSDYLQPFCIPDSLMKNVTLDTVKIGSVMSELKLSGKITFNEDNVVRVNAIVTGHVNEVKVSLGDYVKKGQVLAIVMSSDMAGYINDYKSSKSQLSIANKNLEVTTELTKSGVSSERDIINAQSEYDKALAVFNKMKEVMRIYGYSENDEVSGSEYIIRSPIEGFIVEKNINSGIDLRQDNSSNLFTISDLKELWVVANVYETDISKIRIGNDVDITTISYPDKRFSGKVDKISNILNPETNSMTLRIHLPNSDYSLKPGMYASISILFPENTKMLAIPSRSIMFDDNKSYVILFRKRCDLNLEKIEIIKTFNDLCYIQSNTLHDDDKIINQNALFVFTALKKF